MGCVGDVDSGVRIDLWKAGVRVLDGERALSANHR